MPEFKADLDAMIREAKAQPLAKGVEKIMVAGEPEYNTEQDRRKKGVPLSDAVGADLTTLGTAIGVPFESQRTGISGIRRKGTQSRAAHNLRRTW